ncbi:hypothetical protein BKH46_07370 [Helicobacter sp. 12S02634-8]|uniref:transcriptional regulator n=1 Tax=Helicobacter sp. 12S02634-8 TaxID=1476199 RepID=UPI000BA62940|nr:transcriptional regulator [Helicobacter sp. 12S02634-8]PAF46554.1 hypothetical protein BKH46_07370 [Helicobacter sp. 12S02634-8]
MNQEKEPNLIKKTAKELGLTYRELGEAIGYTEGTLKTASSTNSVSPQIEKAICLFLENRELKQKIKIIQSFKEMLNTL